MPHPLAPNKQQKIEKTVTITLGLLFTFALYLHAMENFRNKKSIVLLDWEGVIFPGDHCENLQTSNFKASDIQTPFCHIDDAKYYYGNTMLAKCMANLREELFLDNNMYSYPEANIEKFLFKLADIEETSLNTCKRISATAGELGEVNYLFELQTSKMIAEKLAKQLNNKISGLNAKLELIDNKINLIVNAEIFDKKCIPMFPTLLGAKVKEKEISKQSKIQYKFFKNIPEKSLIQYKQAKPPLPKCPARHQKTFR